MTTVAYHHKTRQIAVDGRVTTDHLICTDDHKKWFFHKNELWFISGCLSDVDRLLSYHTGAMAGRPEFSINCSALVIRDGKCYQVGVTPEGEPWQLLTEHDFAIGSGRDHALTAMDLKQTAMGAVMYAAKRNQATGGTISVYDIDSARFITGPDVDLGVEEQ